MQLSWLDLLAAGRFSQPAFPLPEFVGKGAPISPLINSARSVKVIQKSGHFLRKSIFIHK
jgi:hypothetical protein